MNKTKLKLLIFCLGLSGTLSMNSVCAQEAVGDSNILSLSLEQAKEYAIEHNKNIIKSKNAIKAALYSKREVIGAYLPQANFTMDYSNYMGAEMSMQFSEQMPPSVIEFNPTSALGISANQLLFNGNAIVGMMLGKIGQQMAEISDENTRLSMRKDVSSAYMSVLLSEKTREILKKNLDDIKDVAAKTKAMADAGAMEQTDADQLIVQVNLIENMLKNSERNSELAYNLLKLQLGADLNAKIILLDKMEDLVGTDVNTKVLNTPYDMSVDPTYRLLQKSEEMAKKQHLSSIMGYLPTIAAFYSFNHKVLKPKMDMTPKNVVGLQLNMPIFTGLQVTNKMRKAKIQYDDAMLDRELIADQLATSEKQLRFNLSTALEKYNTQIMNVDVAYRVFKSIELKYEQGVKSSLDLTNANSNYLKAQTDFLSAMSEVIEARMALEKLLGII